MMKSFTFTADQERALSYIRSYIHSEINVSDPKTYLCTLCGSAGTGKTTLTKHIVKLVRKSGKQVICVAPTHKSRKVLDSMINTSAIIRIPTTTVAGLLGKSRAHSYVGTQHYKMSNKHKMAMYDFIIVDEISMVSTEDFHKICRLAATNEKKLLFIGDHLQIPNPVQKFVRETDDTGSYLVKETNPAFKLLNTQKLKEIVRTDTTNPLQALQTRARDAVGEGFMLADLSTPQSMILDPDPYKHQGYMFLDESGFQALIRSYCSQRSFDGFQSGRFRIVAYTNKTVDQYNRVVRKSLRYEDTLVVGELVTGYNNVGPATDLLIENGQDYRVVSITDTQDHTVIANGQEWSGLHGKIVEIEELHNRDTSWTIGDTVRPIFIPDLNEEANNPMMLHLITLSKRVNRKGSTKADFRNYICLKSELVFMDDLYLYNNAIYTKHEFQTMHPLLFGHTEVLRDTDTGIAVNQKYKGLLSARLEDDKEISASEQLADQFQILERDMSYGYAITSHKSQASTYHTVFMDEKDFNILKDRRDKRTGLVQRNSVERDQMKYVSVTRPSNVLYVCGEVSPPRDDSK